MENQIEARLVHQVTECLLKCGVQQSQIGVISLYRQQLKLLSYLLQERKELEILTADRSQGRDKDCIIISMVRSNDEGQVRPVSSSAVSVFRAQAPHSRAMRFSDRRAGEGLAPDECLLHPGALQAHHHRLAEDPATGTAANRVLRAHGRSGLDLDAAPRRASHARLWPRDTEEAVCGRYAIGHLVVEQPWHEGERGKDEESQGLWSDGGEPLSRAAIIAGHRERSKVTLLHRFGLEGCTALGLNTCIHNLQYVTYG